MPCRPPSPPGTLDRVSKWFSGFKPPKDFLKAKKKTRGNNRRKIKRPPSGTVGIDYDLYDTGEDQNLIFHSGESGRPGGGSGEAGGAAFLPKPGEYDFLDVLNSIRGNETM